MPNSKPQTFNRRAADAIEELLASRIPQIKGRVFVRYDLRRRSHFYVAHHRGDNVFLHFHTSLADPRVHKVIQRAAEACASMILHSSHASAVYGERIDLEALEYN